jgi:hypothetical protein
MMPTSNTAMTHEFRSNLDLGNTLFSSYQLAAALTTAARLG